MTDTASAQLTTLAQALQAFERGDHTAATLSTLARQQTTLLAALPPALQRSAAEFAGPTGIQRLVLGRKLLLQPKGFGGQPDNVGRKSPSHIKRQLTPKGRAQQRPEWLFGSPSPLYAPRSATASGSGLAIV